MKFVYGLLIGLLFVLVGCVPSEPNLAPGTYITELAIEELPERFGPPWTPDRYPGQMLAGQWEITFTEEGQIIWTQNGNEFSEGEYSTKLSTLEFGFDSLCTTYEGITSGSYEWSIVGGELTLERVEDDCEGRAISLTLKPWTRK